MVYTRTLEKIAGRPVTGLEKFLTAVLIVIFLIVFYFVLDANKYAAEVNVIAGEGKVGVNPTTESLDFGDMSPGTTAVREVDIKNATGVPIYILAFYTGGIGDLMKLDQDFFTLQGGASTKLQFTVYMPASAPVGKHLGGHVYIFKIPGPWKGGVTNSSTLPSGTSAIPASTNETAQ